MEKLTPRHIVEIWWTSNSWYGKYSAEFPFRGTVRQAWGEICRARIQCGDRCIIRFEIRTVDGLAIDAHDIALAIHDADSMRAPRWRRVAKKSNLPNGSKR